MITPSVVRRQRFTTLATEWESPQLARDAVILPGVLVRGQAWHPSGMFRGVDLEHGLADLSAALAVPSRRRRPEAFGLPVHGHGQTLIVTGETNGLAQWRRVFRERHPAMPEVHKRRVSFRKPAAPLFRLARRPWRWRLTPAGAAIVADAKAVSDLRVVVLDGELTLADCGRAEMGEALRDLRGITAEVADRLGVGLVVLP